MKIDRLIGIVTILLRQSKTTAPLLAETFEVSVRTIQRDIETICKAGIPLVTTQGYGGGISFAEGYSIDRTLLSEDELQSIFAGVKALDSVSRSHHAETLSAKLSPAGGHILIDLASFHQDSLPEKFERIDLAIRKRRLISFVYSSPKGTERRTVEPYLLLFRWSAWYVYGFCQTRRDFRLFKLNRLWEPELTEKTFAPREVLPDQLDPDRYFSAPSIRLTAQFEPSEKHRLVEEYGPDCFSIAADGTLFFERNFVSYENLREWVFSFGDRVLVLEPPELVEDRIRQAEGILKKQKGT